MPTYPISFISKSVANGVLDAPWIGEVTDQNLPLSIPLEFEGAGGGLSPEDLFNLALSNCFVATFKVIAHNSKLTFSSLAATSELIVDKNSSGLPVMKQAKIQVIIEGASSVPRAQSIANKVAKTGFIINSVTTEILFEFKIT